MLKRLVLIICIIGLTAVSFAANNTPATTIYAYYFHGNVRCATCHKLEQYSKEAIENNFKDELASGRLLFKVINVEEKENAHFINDYQLYTKALVISRIKNGKELKSKNLTRIWELAGNKEGFLTYVKEELASFLKES
jgi:hypothetical protein